MYDGFPTADGIVLTSAFPNAWYAGEPHMTRNRNVRATSLTKGRLIFDRPMAWRWTDATPVELVLKGSCVAVLATGQRQLALERRPLHCRIQQSWLRLENQELIDREKFMECTDHA